MGYEDIADLTHKMENVLDAIRNEQIGVSTEILDVVFESVDHLEEMVMDIEEGGTGQKDVTTLVDTLNRLASGEELVAEPKTSAVRPTQAAITPTASAGSVALDDFEKTVIEQSLEQNFNAYEITIELRDDCILKAARVFMLFEIFEQAGEVIKSSPHVEQLESEDFDTTFHVILLTEEAADALQGKAMKVSEVEQVTITAITRETLG